MRIETVYGNFLLLKNYKDAFDKNVFEQRYINTFDKYEFILGDVSSGLLRLKGFSKNGKHSYLKIPDYLDQFCNYNAPYFILEKIDNEIDEVKKQEKEEILNQVFLKYQKYIEQIEKEEIEKETKKLEKIQKNKQKKQKKVKAKKRD